MWLASRQDRELQDALAYGIWAGTFLDGSRRGGVE